MYTEFRLDHQKRLVMNISAGQDFKAGLLFKKHDWNLYNDHVLFLLTENNNEALSSLKRAKQMHQRSSHTLENLGINLTDHDTPSLPNVSFFYSSSLHPKSYLFKKIIFKWMVWNSKSVFQQKQCYKW